MRAAFLVLMVVVASVGRGAQGPLRQISIAATDSVKSVSPDGIWAALWLSDPDAPQGSRFRGLVIRHLTSGVDREIAAPAATGHVYAPSPVAWSADSSRLAYVWCYPAKQNASAQSECEVRVAAADGSARSILIPRTAGQIEVFHWSPDGRALLALFRQPQTFRVVLIDTNDGRQREVPISDLGPDVELDFRSPAFSPDGRFIAYTLTGWRDKPYNAYLPSDVFVVDLERGESRPVKDGPESETFVGWTPTGALLFTSDLSGTTDLFVASVIDGKTFGPPAVVRQDVGTISGLAVTSKGNLHYQTEYAESWTVELAAFDRARGRVASAPRVLPTDNSRRHSRPEWSVDGQFLAYRSGPAKPQPVFVGDGYDSVTVRDMASGVGRTVRLKHHCTDTWHDWSLAATANPNHWLFSINASAAACRGLYTVDVRTGAVRSIAEGSQYRTGPRALPGGREVVFFRTFKTVVVRDVETGKERVVIDLKLPGTRFESGSFGALALSKTGRRAGVTVKTSNGERYLAELDLVSGLLRVIDDAKLAPGPGFDSVAWAADDRHLLYLPELSTPSDIWMVPVAGGTAHAIGLAPAGFTDTIRWFSLSPDGRQIAFQRERERRPALFVLENVAGHSR